MVAEHGDRVVGFMIYELHKTQAAHPELRRPPGLAAGRGIGRQMVDKLIGKLSSHRRTKITLEVRETNLRGSCSSARRAFER